jgi:hypothetical protein
VGCGAPPPSSASGAAPHSAAPTALPTSVVRPEPTAVDVPVPARDYEGFETRMTIGTPTISGTISDAAVETVVDGRAHQIRWCFGHALAVGDVVPSRSHAVIVITIDPDGAVRRPTTLEDDTTASATLARCLNDAISTWAFAAVRERESIVRIPIDMMISGPPPG